MRAKWTDLAVEAAGGALRENGLSRTVVKVENEESAQKLGRPMGTYITLACEQAMTVSLETRRALAAELAQTLRGMLPPDMKNGAGRRAGQPKRDAGFARPKDGGTRAGDAAHGGLPAPRCADEQRVRRRAGGARRDGHGDGGNSARHGRPCQAGCGDRRGRIGRASSKRIASTIQITDTGITPGSGVGNHRKALDRRTLGVPVIAVGVPLVVYASTIASDALCALGEGEVEEERIAACVERVVSEKLGEMIVTPRDVDALVERMAGVLADGINQALHPSLSSSEIAQLMAQ